MLIAVPPGDVGPEERVKVPVLSRSDGPRDTRALRKAGFSWVTSHAFRAGGKQGIYAQIGIHVSQRTAMGETSKLRDYVTKEIARMVQRDRRWIRIYRNWQLSLQKEREQREEQLAERRAFWRSYYTEQQQKQEPPSCDLHKGPCWEK